MKKSVGYASLAIIDYLNVDQIAVEVISVTSDTCELSGAWVLKSSEIETLHKIIEGRLILTVHEHPKLMEALSSYQKFLIQLDDFLAEASSEVNLALDAFEKFKNINGQEYLKYMAISPAERKKIPKVTKKLLSNPNFFDWPGEIENTKAAEYLESMGKMGIVKGGEVQLQRAIALARVIKLFIDNWKNDEVERKNKIYVEEKDSKITILPNVWLSKLHA
jgi:hypothetical protein